MLSFLLSSCSNSQISNSILESESSLYEDSIIDSESIEENISSEKTSSIIDIEPQIKNVIYLVADGLSSTTLDLARDLKGDNLYLDEFLIGENMVSTSNLSTLANINDSEELKIANTDSSSCGTALATGRKTYKNGQAEVIHKNDNDLVYANDGITTWNNGEVEKLYSILQLAQKQNKKTAIITTADIMDSTPSAFYSHSERGYWDTIYSDLKKSNVNVIVGTNSYSGNTIANWESDFEALGYKTVDYQNISDLDYLDKDDNFISIAESGNGNHNPFWDYDNYMNDNIRLFEYFNKTLEMFDNCQDGFFIMLEGGEIDIGGHNDVPEHAISEIYAFDEVCKQAIDYAYNKDDTIVVVCVDHGNSQYHYIDKTIGKTNFDLEFDEDIYFYDNFEKLTQWMRNNVTKNYKGHTIEDVMLGIFAPSWVEVPFKKENKIENIEIPRYVASLLDIDIDKENRILNGLESEDEFNYKIYDFDPNAMTISKNEDISDVVFWTSDNHLSGFIDSNNEKMHDYENINSSTCYKICFEENRYSLVGLTLNLKEPININDKNLTSLTLRLQISMNSNDDYPIIKLFKETCEPINDEGISVSMHCNSKVVDINLGNIDFALLADKDGNINSFTIGVESKYNGFMYFDEIRFAYKYK